MSWIVGMFREKNDAYSDIITFNLTMLNFALFEELAAVYTRIQIGKALFNVSNEHGMLHSLM